MVRAWHDGYEQCRDDQGLGVPYTVSFRGLRSRKVCDELRGGRQDHSDGEGEGGGVEHREDSFDSQTKGDAGNTSGNEGLADQRALSLGTSIFHSATPVSPRDLLGCNHRIVGSPQRTHAVTR